MRLMTLMTLRTLMRLRRLRIFMRPMREAGRETGHVQITCYSLAPRNPEVFYQKRDLIAMPTTGMTFPLPALAVLAPKHRKRFVLIVMERAMRGFFCTVAKPHLSH
jgi:hypothetical protein